jgi:hypothetical protein
MFTNIVIEIILAFVMLIAGSLFWQLHKRGKYLLHAVHDEQLLSVIISREVLDNPPHIVIPIQSGFFNNIHAEIYSDSTSTKKMMIIIGLIAISILIGSYFLGASYIIINLIIFFLSSLAGVGKNARASVILHILDLAFILDKWHSENAKECEEWVKKAWSLRSVHDSVIKVRRLSNTIQ